MYTIRLKLGDHISDEMAYALAEGLINMAISSSAVREEHKHTAPWTLEWLMEEKPEIDQIITRLLLQAAAYGINGDVEITPENITIEETPDINWLEKCYQDFKPFSIGSFYIYGSHYEGKIPDNKTGLQLDAATAFGSGEHETTNGCLQAMLELNRIGACPWNVLDMGTGSGILALAAWKLWKSPILAVDNDAESIRVTDRHAKMNGVNLNKSCLTTAVGDGFNTPEVATKGPYELIVANILAGPVIEMAPALINVLDDNGYCVLSGMLNAQADLVLSAYEGGGLEYRNRYDIGEWTSLVLQKP